MSQTDPNMLLSFLLLLVIASFTAYYANRKGRNPFIWFILGILLGIFAPLILLFLSMISNHSKNDAEPTMTVSRPDPDLHQQPSMLPPPGPIEIKRQEEENKLWYYLDQNHQQMGPVSVIALRELWNTGRLELSSYVWTEGMKEWEKVENLSELRNVLHKF